MGLDGVLVLEVPAASPAAAAGLRATHRDIFGDIILGDIIIAVDGVHVRNFADLYAALDEHKVRARHHDQISDNNNNSKTIYFYMYMVMYPPTYSCIRT